MEIDAEVTINRFIDEVFAYLTDVEKWPAWISAVNGIRVTSAGPTEPGTTWVQSITILGREIEQTCEVAELERPQSFRYQSVTGPFPVSFRYALTELGPATRVHLHVEGEPGGALRLAAPALAPVINKQIEGDLETLKGTLESGLAAVEMSQPLEQSRPATEE